MAKKKPTAPSEPLTPRDRIIGLDLSLTGTGVALTEAQGGIDQIKTGLLVAKSLRSVERLHWLRGHIMEWVQGPPTQTTLVVIEGYSFGSRNSQAHSLGELGGVVRLACATQGYHMLLVPPQTLKKFVTGKGNATKPEMAVGLYKRWGIEKADDNEADAAALALYGRYATGLHEATTAEQRDALASYELVAPLAPILTVRRRSA